MISASLPGEALGQLGVLPLGHLYPPAPPSGMTPEFLAPQPRPYARYNPRRRDVMPTPPAPAPYPSVPAYPFLPHPASYAPYMYRRAQQQPTYPIRPRASSGFVPPAPAPHSPPTAPAPVPTPREVSKHYTISVQTIPPASESSELAYRFLPHPASYAPYLRALQESTHPIRPRASSVFDPPTSASYSPPTAPAPVPPPRAEPARSPERAAPAPYFCRGALIRLEDGSLRRVEEMRTEDFVMSADRNGELALTQCTLLRLDERGDRLSLTLTYGRNRTQVELDSTVEHPFFVYGRGWASCKPERTLGQYGLHVQRLQVGDVCVSLVPRKHAQAAAPSGTTVHEPVHQPVHQPRPPQHPTSAPPQTHPENLSVKEDARGKRRWSASDAAEDCPPLKKR